MSSMNGLLDLRNSGSLLRLMILLLAISGSARATTRRHPLTNEIVGLGRVIQVYHEHLGKYPESWEELESYSPSLDAKFPRLEPTKRMALVTPPVELPGKYSGMAVAISRDAFRSIQWKERPIIGGDYEHLEDPSYAVAVIQNDGGVSHCRLPPLLAQSVFNQAGSDLPTPSGLGAFADEKRVMRRRIHNWVAAGALATWLVWLLIRRQKNKAANRGPRSD